MFKLDPTASVDGTSLLTLFDCSPVCLVELFGKPSEGDGSKVSGEYVFSDAQGQVFTIYDWKRTTLYHGEHSGAPTPEEFWDSDEPESLCVGGIQGSDPSVFLRWLVDQWEHHQSKLATLMDRIDKALRKSGAKNDLDDLAELYEG